MLRVSHQGRVGGLGKRLPHGIEAFIYRRAKNVSRKWRGSFKGVQGLRQMGGAGRWDLRHRNGGQGGYGGEQLVNSVMSACPRDSSNTELSSRLSGMCLLCRLFSCPPPRTLQGKKETSADEERCRRRKKNRKKLLTFSFLKLHKKSSAGSSSVTMAAMIFF